MFQLDIYYAFIHMIKVAIFQVTSLMDCLRLYYQHIAK